MPITAQVGGFGQALPWSRAHPAWIAGTQTRGGALQTRVMNGRHTRTDGCVREKQQDDKKKRDEGKHRGLKSHSRSLVSLGPVSAHRFHLMTEQLSSALSSAGGLHSTLGPEALPRADFSSVPHSRPSPAPHSCPTQRNTDCPPTEGISFWEGSSEAEQSGHRHTPVSPTPFHLRGGPHVVTLPPTPLRCWLCLLYVETSPGSLTFESRGLRD